MTSHLIASNKPSVSHCEFFQHQFCSNAAFESKIECPEIDFEGNLDFDEEFSIPLRIGVNGIIALSQPSRIFSKSMIWLENPASRTFFKRAGLLALLSLLKGGADEKEENEKIQEV